VSKLLAPVSASDIDAFYRSAGVLRPPAVPASSVGEIMGTLRDMLQFVTIPSVGVVTLILGLSVGLICLVTALVDVLFPTVVSTQLKSRSRLNDSQVAELLSVSRLVGALAFGTVLGMAFFAPLSLHIYLKHQFPLIVGPL